MRLLKIAGRDPDGNAKPFSLTDNGEALVKESPELSQQIGDIKNKDFATETTLSQTNATLETMDGVLDSILAKIIAAPATAAKQDAAKEVLDAIAGKDFATQTTLAAILAKLSDLATATKQDSAKAVLDSIAAEDFATAAKQDVAKGVLDTIAGKDFATQTTLAAILAKLSADPATQTTLNALKTLFDSGNAQVQLKGSLPPSMMELAVNDWDDLPDPSEVPVGATAQLIGTFDVRQNTGAEWVEVVL